MRRKTFAVFTNFLVALTLLKGPSSFAADEKSSTDVPHFEIYNSSIAAPKKMHAVVRSQSEPELLWKDMQSEVKAAPVIDLSEHMMLGIFLGFRPASERSNLTLVSVKRKSDPDRIEITYKIKERDRTEPPSPSLTAFMSDHGLWLVPRSKLPVHFIHPIGK
ncbi:hypothetical protein [Noviherbaspirillum aerium]|uniref:hypothetical protein n=1 Tax=Noviherbaspirillum aerium TaxID=2588497 RepID=UPI00124EAF45|nr:hypothetical protein [Noviherbaspirillum aerium]